MALQLNPIQRLRARRNRAASEKQIVYYTHGPDLISPGEYRASFDIELGRALQSYRNVSDDTLAHALPVSAAAYSCTEYRASTTANIPLKVRLNGEDAPTHPLGYFLSEAPQIMDDVTRSALIWGRFYLLKQRNKNGWPTGLKWLNPLNVREVTEGYGRVIAYDVQEVANGGHKRHAPSEIVYSQFFDPNPWGMGLSKFEAAWRALNIDLGISTFAAAFFMNRAQPDGILILDRTSPLSDAEYNQFKAHWREQFKGAQQAHKTAFIDMKATWTPTTGAPKDLAMVELKQTDREDICAIFEVDPMLVGLKDAGDPLSANSTLSTAEVNHIQRVTIPFLRTTVLSALNTQWAQTDFDQPYALVVDEKRVPALAEAKLLQADTAIKLTESHVSDYPEAREILGYEARDDYLKRNPTEVSKLWQDGQITRAQYNKLVGVPGFVEGNPNDNVVLINGTLYPADRLLEVAQANAAKVGQPDPAIPSPFGSFSVNNQLPEIKVSTPEPKQLPAAVGQVQRTSSTGTPEAYAILSLANDEQLIAYQNKLKSLLPDIDGIRWTPPEEFHITLWYAPLVSYEQLDAVIASASTEVITGEVFTTAPLSSFDGDGVSKPLILPVEATDALRQLQGVQVSQLQALGVTISEYSEPDAYNPHITLAYVTSDLNVPDVPDILSVKPQALRFSRGDYYSMGELPIRHKPTRSTLPLEVAVSFANNQFVRYARRLLSEALTEQGVQADWTDAAHWRIPLARSGEWTPALLSAVLRSVTWEDTRKLDLPSGGLAQRDSAIYLTARTDSLDTLLKAVRTDMEGMGLDSAAVEGEGILIARIRGDSAVTLPDAPVYPLVGNNLTLYLGDEEYHRWALRGVSQAQIGDIRAWRRAAKNRGRDYDFSPDALEGHPIAQFIRWALGQAEVELTAIFDAAEKMLKGDLPVLDFVEAGE